MRELRLPHFANVSSNMKKTISIVLICLLLCILLPGCNQPEEPTEPVCNHYDMDVDDICDACGESLFQEVQSSPTQTQPEYGNPVLRLYAEYVLGAYSSGITTMVLYDSNTATVESVVDTSAVGQGEQQIAESGTWQYDAESDSYTVTFKETQYVLEKNADGLFSTQYFFTMRGQTGGYQSISIVPVEIP